MLLYTTYSVSGFSSCWTCFSYSGTKKKEEKQSIWSEFTYRVSCPPGLVAVGLNCSARMLMISPLNAPVSSAKCIQLCMFMPRATNSLLTIARKGGCVRVYSSLDLNLWRSAGLFSLHTRLDVQIHTDTPVAETILRRYLEIHPGLEKRQAAYETIIIALRLHADESVLLVTFSFWH